MISKLCKIGERIAKSDISKQWKRNGIILLLLIISGVSNVYFISQDPRFSYAREYLKPLGIHILYYLLAFSWKKLTIRESDFKILQALLNVVLIFLPLISWIVPFDHLRTDMAIALGAMTLTVTFFLILWRRYSGSGSSIFSWIIVKRVCDSPELLCAEKLTGDTKSLDDRSTLSEDSLVDEEVHQKYKPLDVQMEAIKNIASSKQRFPSTYRSRSSSLSSCAETDEESYNYESSTESISEENVHHTISQFSKGACGRLLERAKSLVRSARNLSKSHSDSEITGLDSISARVSSYDYESSDGKWNAEESESMELYKPGGYHPTVQGEIFNYRYVALEKVGWGECSIVWLARDSHDSDKLVALKISRASVLHKNCAINEAHICTIMRDRLKRAGKHYDQMKLNASCVMEMYDSFEHEGPHGVHFVSVLERLGPNLLSLMTLTEFRGLPNNMVRYIAKRILHGLTFLHDEINVCHADIKPENILLANELSDESGPLFLKYSVKVSDLGSGRILDYSYPLSVLQTREYRAPEVLIGCESMINQAIDVWSLGCVIFELLTGDFLFDPKSQVDSSRAQDLLQMNLIMQVCGEVPKKLLHGARYGNHFFRKGSFIQERLPRIDLKNVMVSSYNMSIREAESFCDFLLPMLEIDPAKRVKARDHTQHEWLQLTADQLNEIVNL